MLKIIYEVKNEVDFIVEVESMDADRLKENSDITVLQYNDTSHNWLISP